MKAEEGSLVYNKWTGKSYKVKERKDVGLYLERENGTFLFVEYKALSDNFTDIAPKKVKSTGIAGVAE